MKMTEVKSLISAIVSLREGVTDKVASLSMGAYPTLHGDGRTIEAGTRIHHGGRLLRAAVTLFDTPENVPEKAPNLWEEISYREGYRIIPEVITSGLAFQKGERGWWNNELWESTIDTNSWNPDNYPSAWKKADLNVDDSN